MHEQQEKVYKTEKWDKNSKENIENQLQKKSQINNIQSKNLIYMKYNGTIISSHLKRRIGFDKLEKMSSSCLQMPVHGKNIAQLYIC